MEIKAFIFDLDGVIVSTDEYHYLGWKKLAEEEGIPYSREVNLGQRGVSRMESLEVMLRNASRTYSEEEKVEMAARKNSYYVDFIASIKPEDKLPGVDAFLAQLREKGLACAIGSSSKNTKRILAGIGMADFFDAVSDGTQITKSKPDPEVFLLAAKLLGIDPANCVVVEDADAGVEAAIAAGMKVIAVGSAKENPKADIGVNTLAEITVDDVIAKLA